MKQKGGRGRKGGVAENGAWQKGGRGRKGEKDNSKNNPVYNTQV